MNAWADVPTTACLCWAAWGENGFTLHACGLSAALRKCRHVCLPVTFTFLFTLFSASSCLSLSSLYPLGTRLSHIYFSSLPTPLSIFKLCISSFSVFSPALLSPPVLSLKRPPCHAVHIPSPRHTLSSCLSPRCFSPSHSHKHSKVFCAPCLHYQSSFSFLT